jgi:hypothetical protein
VLAAAVGLGALLCACAPAPVRPAPAAGTAGCDELGASIARSEVARSAAVEAQQGAWKRVLPFLVAARLVEAGTAVEAADAELRDRRAAFDALGCAAAAN